MITFCSPIRRRRERANLTRYTIRSRSHDTHEIIIRLSKHVRQRYTAGSVPIRSARNRPAYLPATPTVASFVCDGTKRHVVPPSPRRRRFRTIPDERCPRFVRAKRLYETTVVLFVFRENRRRTRKKNIKPLRMISLRGRRPSTYICIL